MVSVITVVWNGVKTIEETILSVLSQDYPDVEYVIIDGVSTDGTLEILAKYADKIKLISEPDKGIYDAMNKGILNAKGNWVYFMGCDDVFYDQSVLSKIFLRPGLDKYDFVYGSVQFLHSKLTYDGEFDHDKLCNRSICHQSVFYRKSVFDRYGYFSIDYKSASDYIFNLKAFCLDISKWLYVDEIVTIYNEKGLSQAPEEKYLDNSFAIRYDNFKILNSKFILSRIFWSSYFRYFIKHDIRTSIKYLLLVFKDVGLINLIVNFFIILKKRYRQPTDV